MIGAFDVDLTHEFFQGFVNHALVTLHIDNLRGDNAHHQAETVFKAFARALRMAVEPRSARRAASCRRPRGRSSSRRAAAAVPRLSSADPLARDARHRRRRLRHGQPALGGQGAARMSRPSATIVVTADPAAIRARRPRRAARARARCPTACAASTRAGLREVVRGGRARPAVPRHLPRPADAVRRQRGGADRRPRRAAGPGRALPRRRRWSTPTARGSRCRTWAGARCAQARAHPLWQGIADGTRFYFAHSYYPVPARPEHDGRRPPTIRRRLLARLRGLISSPCSSIRKRATAPVSSCSPTSSPGTGASEAHIRRTRVATAATSSVATSAAMQIIPAIDIKDGHCVRLKQGEMQSATVFSEDPAAMAQHWLEQGAQRLHLVDLNGAFAGKPKNELAIREIVSVDRRGDPGAAGRRHPRPRHDRALSRRRHHLRHHRHRGGQESRASCTTPATRFPATSSSASTRATARSRPTAGRR